MEDLIEFIFENYYKQIDFILKQMATLYQKKQKQKAKKKIQ